MSHEETRRLRFLIRCWEELERRRGARPLSPLETAYHLRLGEVVPVWRLLLAAD